MTKRFLIAAVVLVALPLFSFAQESGDGIDITGTATTTYSDTPFQRNGVFGCSVNGSYSMSVGSLSAVGGVYVPVNDAAVTLNTGYLVYKECTLRGIVDRMRENSTAVIQKAIIQAYQRGRAGLPLFSQSLPLEGRAVYDNTVVSAVQNGYLNSIDPAYRNATQRAIVQGYMAVRNQPQQAFACPTSSSYWDRIGNLSFSPGCNSYGAYYVANTAVMAAAAAQWNDKLTQLQWGNGTYPRTVIDPATGEEIVVTPGQFVASNALQALQTGFVQLQNANDIDQIVTALFSGITTQVVSDQSGLSGLTQKNGSQQSYLDRVVSDTATALRNSAANAALGILSATMQVERGILDILNALGTKFVDTINKIRAQESACWALIIDKVCAAAPDANNKCTAKPAGCTTDANGTQTCPAAVTLKVATTTTASEAVINAYIRPHASSTALAITNQQHTIDTLTQLITNVTNSSDASTQFSAIKQVDVLVSQHVLHTDQDRVKIQSQADGILNDMDALPDNTAKLWGDSLDVSVGWCNVNSPALLEYWKNKWKQ